MSADNPNLPDVNWAPDLDLGAHADAILSSKRRRLTAANAARSLGDGGLVRSDALLDLIDSLDESRVLLEKAVVALLEQVEVLGRVVAHQGDSSHASVADTPEGMAVGESASPDSPTADLLADLSVRQAETTAELARVTRELAELNRTSKSAPTKGASRASRLGRRNDRGSTLILALVLCAIFAAVIWACLSLAPDVQPILEQVDESVGQFIGGAW